MGEEIEESEDDNESDDDDDDMVIEAEDDDGKGSTDSKEGEDLEFTEIPNNRKGDWQPFKNFPEAVMVHWDFSDLGSFCG